MKYFNKAFFGTMAGNIMEFYDFVIYGYLSIYLSPHYFPSNDETVSLLMTLSVFASGYLVRPLGSVVFGHIGDKWGRKPALLYSISLITLSTLLMGFLPTYKQIGIFAPIALCLLRLLQGLAVSGEQGGAIVYLAEYFQMKQIGMLSALMLTSVLLGVLLGLVLVLLCQSLLIDPDMQAWGWRIPFIFSLILGLISLKLRLDSIESPIFKRSIWVSQNIPIVSLLKNNLFNCLKMFLLSISFAVPMSFHNTYLPIFYSKHSSFGLKNGILISALGILWISLLSPIAGMLSEKIGYMKTIQIGCLLLLMFGYLIFELLNHGTTLSVFIMEVIFGIIVALISAPLFAVLVQKFPTETRYTGVSLSYNLGMSLFASLTPMVAILLIQSPGKSYLIGVLLSLSSLIGIIAFGNLFGFEFKSLFVRSSYERV